MSNLYHIIHKLPALERNEMFRDLEYLAVRLVKSGRLRIEADNKINYARFTIPNRKISMMISKRELNDPSLLKKTKKMLTSLFRGSHPEKNIDNVVEQEINRLRAEISKYQIIDKNLEMKIARILVQSAHPVVILLLLIEDVEIYVSYSYNIGDMLDIVSWQQSGQNSGMQSTNGRDVAIFTSAGGDPFGNAEKDAIFGDGIPAIARMMVIAGQEIGHYSDIMRDNVGRQISRHSANFSGTKAKDNVRLARIKDIENIDKIRFLFTKIGMDRLFEYERHLKFFIKNKKWGIFARIKIWIMRLVVFIRANKYKLDFIKDDRREKFIASKNIALLADMRFNLAPVADVYQSADKDEEEAIACIEALARIPQQALKWGHRLTRILMPKLYVIYYKQVIPDCIKTYENITGKKYNIKLEERVKPVWFTYLKNIFKKKPIMYKSWHY